ncbi:lipoprotein [Salmonella enterica subsp. indica]|uniref:Lipoprotein n=1 Tax=Salmonella enterica subsp. indica TaxID=59207 RepID=A0A379XM34_SALER|nr:lipoprotein [Salmonella enterica subsp. indica]
MNFRLAVYLCAATFLLAGCVPRSPIDARKTSLSGKESNISKSTIAAQLTDKDIFGNETTLAVSEEDIQAALEGETFHVPMNSAVILVQSGSRAPEAMIQQEMSKYYTVSTFSGIPDRQKPVTCNKDKTKIKTTRVRMSRLLKI